MSLTTDAASAPPATTIGRMSRLADPSICPDCRAPLDPATTCTGCGLRLAGPRGQAAVADDARRRPAGRGDPGDLRACRCVASTARHRATARCAVPRRTADRESSPGATAAGASVPVVLLSLGALCLLVAAVVFVAITWGSLGLTGRTLVLLGVTGLFATAATLVTRRGLRGAAESCWTIVAGMLALDLLAARAAGLAGSRRSAGSAMSLLLGGTLFALGVGVALWARRTPIGTLAVPQVVAVLGALVAAAGGAWLAPTPAVGTALAVPVLVALALPPGAAPGPSSLPCCSGWPRSRGSSWPRSASCARPSSAPGAAWWTDLRGWPLLVAVGVRRPGDPALDGCPTCRGPCSPLRRWHPLAVLANAPGMPGNETRDDVLAGRTLVALAALARLAPRAWALAAAALGSRLRPPGSLARVAAVVRDRHLPAPPRRTCGCPAVDSAAAPWTWPVARPRRGRGAARLAAARSGSSSDLPATGGGGRGSRLARPGRGGRSRTARRPCGWCPRRTGRGCVPAGSAWCRRPTWTPAAVGAAGAAAGSLVVVGLAAALPSSRRSRPSRARRPGAPAGRRGRRASAVARSSAPALTGGLAVLAGHLRPAGVGHDAGLPLAAATLVLAVVRRRGAAGRGAAHPSYDEPVDARADRPRAGPGRAAVLAPSLAEPRDGADRASARPSPRSRC